MQGLSRDRDPAGRPRNARPRDDLGRPLERQADASPPADEPALPPELALGRAQQLLDEGKPFTAHEVLEAVWKASAAPDRMLWKGLAQLAVGLTHQARGNPAGARALLTRAGATLAPFAGQTPYGVAVDRLRAWVDAGGPAGPPPLVDQAADARD